MTFSYPFLQRAGLILAAQFAVLSFAQAQTETQTRQLRSDSYHAFQRGDVPRALELLTASLDLTQRTPNPDLQRLSALVQFCYWLRNAGDHTRAAEVSEFALSAGQSAVSQATNREAARAHVILGGLHENVRNDLAQARASYEAALRFQPGNASVRRRLDHLRAIENHATDKNRGDAILRGRTKPNS